jgi:hypothetical protein
VLQEIFCAGLGIFGTVAKLAEYLKVNSTGEEVTPLNIDFQGLDELETKKKLLLIMASKRPDYNFGSAENFIERFKEVAAFTTNILHFSNLKEVLKSDEDKSFFRNFAFRVLAISYRKNFDVSEWSFMANVCKTNDFGKAIFPLATFQSFLCSQHSLLLLQFKAILHRHSTNQERRTAVRLLWTTISWRINGRTQRIFVETFQLHL